MRPKIFFFLNNLRFCWSAFNSFSKIQEFRQRDNLMHDKICKIYKITNQSFVLKSTILMYLFDSRIS